MDFNRERTLEEKASLAAELAIKIRQAVKSNDLQLYETIDSDARAYFKRADYLLYGQANDILKANPEISQIALALRVLEWGKKKDIQ